jgi:hypothetical protein
MLGEKAVTAFFHPFRINSHIVKSNTFSPLFMLALHAFMLEVKFGSNNRYEQNYVSDTQLSQYWNSVCVNVGCNNAKS